MLENEFKYFLKNKDVLLQKYKGKYIVIRDNSIIGSYDTEIEAYNETQKKYALGSFLIQPCADDAESLSQTYHSRVLFK